MQNENTENRNTKRIMKEVDATMTMEGMPLTPEDKDRMSRYLNGEITVKEAIDEITLKHKR